MTVASIIGAIIVVAVVLYFIIRSGKKEAHHLDGLHILSGDEDQR